MIVNDKLLTEDLYNLSLYANVGAQWAKALQDKTLNKKDFLQWLSESQTLAPTSHCVTAVVHRCFSLVERLSNCMILLPETVWHCGQTFYLFLFYLDFLKKKKIM